MSPTNTTRTASRDKGTKAYSLLIRVLEATPPFSPVKMLAVVDLALSARKNEIIILTGTVFPPQTQNKMTKYTQLSLVSPPNKASISLEGYCRHDFRLQPL